MVLESALVTVNTPSTGLSIIQHLYAKMVKFLINPFPHEHIVKNGHFH
jgi:hypothetical protein